MVDLSTLASDDSDDDDVQITTIKVAPRRPPMVIELLDDTPTHAPGGGGGGSGAAGAPPSRRRQRAEGGGGGAFAGLAAARAAVNAAVVGGLQGPPAPAFPVGGVPQPGPPGHPLSVVQPAVARRGRRRWRGAAAGAPGVPAGGVAGGAAPPCASLARARVQVPHLPGAHGRQQQYDVRVRRRRASDRPSASFSVPKVSKAQQPGRASADSASCTPFLTCARRHVFCTQCITECVAAQRKCPTCRKALKKNNVFK